jgi:Kef-type K+ transport system membrane component KefB
MASYLNHFRRRMIERLGLLVSLPVFLVAFGAGALEISYLRHGSSVSILLTSLVGAAAVSSSLTMVAVFLSLPHCPVSLEVDGNSLKYRRFRWVQGRPGRFQVELPLAAIRSVGPTALGATQIEGTAFVSASAATSLVPFQVSELLLVSPETAQEIGISQTRPPAPWFRRSSGVR